MRIHIKAQGLIAVAYIVFDKSDNYIWMILIKIKQIQSFLAQFRAIFNQN